MKKLLQILFLLAFFLVTTSAQDRIHRGVTPERLNAERLLMMHLSKAGGLQEMNDRESLLLKSESTNWKTALRNQQAIFYEEEGFYSKDPRTSIKKTLLGNGFLLIEIFSQLWKDSAWVNKNKYSYMYDGSNNLIEYIQQTWDGSAWVNKNKHSYAYDGNNNQTEWIIQTWDGSVWVVQHKASYTYDGNNNQTGGITQIWDGSAWVNSGKVSYTYDGKNNQTEVLSQIWNGSAWVNSSKDSNTYDGNNNKTEVISQYWNGSAWVNISRDLYTYDGNNNQTEIISQIGGGSQWVNSAKNSFTYDENNNLTGILSQYWDWQNSIWINDRKILYSYAPMTAINDNLSSINSYSLSNNYPNPFNPSTKINYQIPTAGIVSLKVYDMLGRQVSILANEVKNAGNYQVEFDGSELSNGIYFYQLRTNGFNEVKKMLLVK